MIEKETSCLLCGEKAEFKMIKKGYQEPDTFDIYHCENCDTSFSLPRVETGPIYQLIYKNGDKVPGYDRYWKYLENVKKHERPIEYLMDSEECYWGVYSAITDDLKLPKSAEILEIGSGLGYFTYAFYKDGFHSIKGLEISQEAVDKATASFGSLYICADVRDYAEENPGKFDAVILTEVIEHIEDSLEFTKALHKLLKKGGSIIMTTPNKSFCPSYANWATDLPPVHCWWFSEKSFKHIADTLSLSYKCVDFSRYYKNHDRVLRDLTKYTNEEGKYLFDKDGNFIGRKEEEKNHGIFPRCLKKNKLYKNFRKIYPLLSSRFVLSNQRTYVLCVILTKK